MVGAMRKMEYSPVTAMPVDWNCPRPGSGRSRNGFTLLELLAVVAIVAILTTAATVALVSLVSSARLTQSADLLQGIFTMARRTAISHSHIVEVRFFQCTDPSNPGSDVQWRALQAVEILEDGAGQPIQGVTILPNRYMMSASATASPLLNDTNLNYAGTSPAILGTVSNFRRFRFMPDGGTDLPLLDPTIPEWFLTLYNENDIAKGDPPPNYATLQVDPSSGAITTLRP